MSTLKLRELKLLEEAADLGLFSTQLKGTHVAMTGMFSLDREDMHVVLSAVGAIAVSPIETSAELLLVGLKPDSVIVERLNQRGVTCMRERDLVLLLWPETTHSEALKDWDTSW